MRSDAPTAGGGGEAGHAAEAPAAYVSGGTRCGSGHQLAHFRGDELPDREIVQSTPVCCGGVAAISAPPPPHLF